MSIVDFNSAIAALEPHGAAIALIAARLLPVAFLCPLLGGPTAPTTVKLSAVLALAFALHIAGGVRPSDTTVGFELLAVGLRELMLGVAIGLIAAVPFDAARIGGRLTDLFRGSSAEAALPHAGTKEAASGDALYQLAVAMTAATVAMPMALAALFRSYALLPLGSFVATESVAALMATVVGTTFATGLAIGAPVAGTSLAVDALLGLSARAVPQLNLQETGTPVKILVGAAALWVGLGAISSRLMVEVSHIERTIATLAEVAS